LVLASFKNCATKLSPAGKFQTFLYKTPAKIVGFLVAFSAIFLASL